MSKEKARVIFLKGLPASGKSTWAREFVTKHQHFIRINKDDLRAMFTSDFSKPKEGIVLWLRDFWIQTALGSWFGVVVDDTNFNPAHEDTIKAIAGIYWKDFEVKFFDVPLEECIERNSKRENAVPEKVIRDMAQRYKVWTPETMVLEQDSTKTRAYIFDIDGTLAKMNGRSPYDYTRVSEDLPNEPIVNLSKTLYDAGYTILVCSGREWTDQCRADTLQWIKRQGIPMTSLFMREEWDKRPDTEVKREMLYNEILPDYYIEWVFDDRNRVVKMFRESWLTVLQVAEGNF